MADSYREALLRRRRQWKAFHEWEENRDNPSLTFGERVGWYAAAFEFFRGLQAKPMTADKRDKATHLRNLQARLKHLKRSDGNG